MFWKNIRFIGHLYYKHVRKVFLFLFMSLAGMILTPLLSVYLSRTVILAVAEAWSVERMVFWAGAFTMGLVGCNILSTYGTTGYREHCSYGRFYIARLWQRMMITCRYELLEDPKWQQETEDVGNEVVSDWHTHGLTGFSVSIFQIFGSVIGIVAFSAILSKMHFAILLLLAITSILSGVIDMKAANWEHEQRVNWQPYDRKISYIYNHITTGKAGKDIRLFEATDYYLKQMQQAFLGRMVWIRRVLRKRLGVKGFGVWMLIMQNGAALGWIIYEMVQGSIDVTDFTLYAGSVVQFTQFINQFLQWIGILRRSNLDVQKIRESLRYMPEDQQVEVGLKKKEKEDTNTVKSIDIETAPTIQFDHVTFFYPGSNQAILDDVSFRIEAGEKIALVGENGAGKTTIVKLLCGLYQPTSGRIMVNGVLLSELSEASRCALVAAVFQDMLVLPFNVLENVSIGSETDVKRVRACLEKAGLSKRFPNLNMNLVKGSAEDAENLSGGEQQKLLLARALYKDAPVLILDEPTAALDPLAESQLYEQYHELTKTKTAIFISHRLASTRFCTRIFLLGNGKILEEGSHEELLAADGRYAQMFFEQSKYYQEAAEKERSELV